MSVMWQFGKMRNNPPYPSPLPPVRDERLPPDQLRHSGNRPYPSPRQHSSHAQWSEVSITQS